MIQINSMLTQVEKKKISENRKVHWLGDGTFFASTLFFLVAAKVLSTKILEIIVNQPLIDWKQWVGATLTVNEYSIVLPLPLSGSNAETLWKITESTSWL